MSWDRFKQYFLPFEDLKFSLDISRMNFPPSFITEMDTRMKSAFESMEALENGAIANPDENRMVGHYWLRTSRLAPDKEIQREIELNLEQIREFSSAVRAGNISGETGNFKNLLIIGIGGSALGPQLIHDALVQLEKDTIQVYFFDNTDPDGIDMTLARLKNQLGYTLVIVISKSGNTAETRNGMEEAKFAYREAGLDFNKHAVAVTHPGSTLDQHAIASGWVDHFPLWDWVGGRTSIFSSVGLLPAALLGIDILEMRKGAAAMDEVTRIKDSMKNPAALLALMWYFATEGKGSKDMVILPYKDRLSLFSRYLQQLVMESLGKESDLESNRVHQGIAVYGNKGSTDQHAYVQQLRDGVANFFVTFIEVLKDRKQPSQEIEPHVTSGDYLQGFFLGTRSALHEKGRQSITITIDEVNPYTLSLLIALYERAVGLYASLIGINAYHQPGVEAGKKTAVFYLKIKNEILKKMSANPGKAYTPETLASELNLEIDTEIIFKLLEHLSANPEKGIFKNQAAIFFNADYHFKP
jgi:glucose-6-phosphate isomerase